MMLVARRNKLLTAVVLSLAVCIGAATASLSAQDTAQGWPIAWEPNFDPVPGSRSTLVLTNIPTYTGMILPFDKVRWASNVGPSGNEQYTTYLVGSPGRGQMYLQWRIWPPGNTAMTEAHWHRERRTEVMVFGSGYWMGHGSVVDFEHRRHSPAGDFFTEQPGGWHFGWSDPNDPSYNVMFFFGTEPLVDEPKPRDSSESHVEFGNVASIQWEPAKGTGPMTSRLLGDASQADWYNEFNKWSPGSSIQAHAHSDDRYGVVVSGTISMSYGNTSDPAQARKMPQGTFFTQPAGIGHFMYVSPDATEDAVILMIGKGPSRIVPITPPRATS
jgi:uncharacterized RmlC-like cupin family protein